MTVRVTVVETPDALTVASVIKLAWPNSNEAIDVGAASSGSTDVAAVPIGVDGALTVTLMVSTGSGRVANAADTAAAAAVTLSSSSTMSDQRPVKGRKSSSASVN